jgi:hypothetical protein
MFQCTIEMLSYLEPGDEPKYFGVASYDFDPGLQVGEEAWVYWKVWGKHYDIKVKVAHRKKEIVPKGSHPNYELRDMNLFKLRIFVEPEDREMAIEIAETLRKCNL